MSRGSSVPRVVVVTRRTDYEELIRRHGTRDQARFFLKGRNQELEPVELRHSRQEHALATVLAALPNKWRRSRIDRADLDRFLFEPDDMLIAVGQDGLVANLAKYLDGQPVIGINPDPTAWDGVLAPHPAEATGALVAALFEKHALVEARSMVAARFDDGQTLRALNELFIGHRGHQSARYRLRAGDQSERQSSSGILVATGTGSTGWARSVHRQRRTKVTLPRPEDPALVYFVREAFPSISTGVEISDGRLDAEAALEVVSEMNDGGVVFGDGIESDHIDFHFGMRVSVRLDERRLHLVRSAG